MKKMFSVFCAIFIASLGVAQTSTFTDYVSAISHDTALIYGQAFAPTGTDTLFVYAERSVNANLFVSASDTIPFIGAGVHNINGLALRNLPDSTVMVGRIRAFVKDTAGNAVLDMNPQGGASFMTKLAPKRGVTNDLDLLVQGTSQLKLRLRYSCGNILTPFTIEWGYAPSNYTAGSLTLSLIDFGDTSFTVSNLPQNTTVYFRVVALNALGFGTPYVESFQTANVQNFVLSVGVLLNSFSTPDSAEIEMFYSTGTYGPSILSGVLKDSATHATITTMAGMGVTGSGSHWYTVAGMQPSTNYYWVTILSDSAGLITLRDTLRFTSNPPIDPSGAITAVSSDWSSLTISGTFNTNGLYVASSTTFFYELYDHTDGVSLYVRPLGVYTGAGNFTHTECDLLGGHTYSVYLYGQRGTWVFLLDSYTKPTVMPQTPSILVVVDTLPGRYLRTKVITNGKGNYLDLRIQAFVNRDATLMVLDTALGSCPDTITWLSGPFDYGDSVFMDASIAYGPNLDHETDGKWFFFPELPDTTTPPPPVGINETTNEVAIFVTTSVVNVAEPIAESLTFQVFNLAGQRMYQQDLVNGYNHYRIDNAMGIYLYQISNDAGEIIKTGKILY